jgi:hypothetical protein
VVDADYFSYSNDPNFCRRADPAVSSSARVSARKRPMTFLGVFFIPVALVCFLWQPFYLLPLLMLASIFEAGSVLNGAIGDFEFGISPFYLTEIFIVLRLLMLAFGPAKLLNLLPRRVNPMRAVAWVLLAFWLWCFFSAFVMPHLFAGTSVSVPRNGTDEDFAPLHWSLSNLAQAGYLTLNVATVMYALHIVRTHRQTEQLVKALYFAVFIVVIIGCAQFLAAKEGWDFPYETFNNNPVYGKGIDQDIESFHRINSTFNEPSMAGSYLASITCGLLASFLTGRRGLTWLLALLGVTTTLFLTTSTTGFAAVAIGVVVLLLYFNPFRGHKEGGKSSALGWVVILAVFGAMGAVLFFTPDLLDAVLSTTVEKGDSYSFWVRLANEFHSMGLVLQTYGLGVGLGSNRSSGLIPTMLSSVGLVGTSLFTAVLYKIARAFPGRSARSSLQIGFWALLTMIISETVAVPDLNRSVLWALLVLVLTQLKVDLDPLPNMKPSRLSTVSARRPALQPSPRIAPAS